LSFALYGSFLTQIPILKTGENRELILLEKTQGNLDRNGSTRNQNVWEFPFNLIWSLSIIAIMDSVHDTLKASIKPLKTYARKMSYSETYVRWIRGCFVFIGKGKVQSIFWC
jgi:hypothetical protein